MEMATALHSSPTPFISLTNPNPKRGFSFSSSLLVNQPFGRTLSSTLTTKPPFNFHSRNSIRTSLKCSVSGATEAVPVAIHVSAAVVLSIQRMFTLPCAIHGFLLKCGYQSDIFRGNNLVSMCVKFNRLDDAQQVFDEMLDRNTITWTSLINGCSLFEFDDLEHGNAGYGEKALWFFLDLLHIGLEPNDYTFTNVISACNGTVGLEKGRQLHGLAIKHGLMGKTSVGNIIITMYGRYGLVEEAECIFYGMAERNLVSWTALLSAYVKNGHVHKAFVGFLDMVNQGLNLDSNCLSCVLDCCSECQNLDFGLQIRGFVIKPGGVGRVGITFL
ncbi:hypothetical protein TEA_005230 [Camellia sinensis var. sinensis]|uniref:Pentatricopeptide repeat-containing protein n=1 Tax=Camellia sinensis var. sinensis TaxID=542762 RepID=A0A4V3WLY4_CAMSN|nr:hypothetical protein TEA_005230 [Camellia sinensis var. sinensis]